MLILRRTIVLVQHLVSSLSLGGCSDHGLPEDSRVCVRVCVYIYIYIYKRTYDNSYALFHNLLPFY